MFKFLRKVLLTVFLVTLLIIPAYSESNEVEHPIIFIPCGTITEYLLLDALINSAKIKADIIYDLNFRFVNSPSYLSDYWSLGEIESMRHKTAVFVFGTIFSTHTDPDTGQNISINLDKVIMELKDKVAFCRKNGIRMIGIQLFNRQTFHYLVLTLKSNSLKIIEEFVPFMDSLVVIRTSEHWPEVNELFEEVGKAHGIPIEYFTSTKLSSDYGSLLIQEFSMMFGE